jgi:hypothetical protein
MKTIVVAGARSKVGKTTLARALCQLLPGAMRVKIGHGQEKPGDDTRFYHLGTLFGAIAADHPGARYLVIESNSILRELTPDCAIFLPADDPKPSAAFARAKADAVRGELLDMANIASIASRLECDEETMREIARLSGAALEKKGVSDDLV